MQNTLLHSDNTPKSSRQVARKNLELLDTLASPSKGIFSQKQTQSVELVENLNQKNTRKGQFSHLMNGTIEDWKLEYNKHPEWLGLSTRELQNAKGNGGSSFYAAFTIWKKKQIDSIKDMFDRREEDNRLKNIIFPDKYRDRSDLKTIEDWKAEYNKHPEWEGLSTEEIKQRNQNGGCGFYAAFLKWKKKQVEGIKDEEERKKEDNRLKNILFTDKKQDRSNFTTIEDWKVEYNKHPEWQGLSTTEMGKKKGGWAFYQAFTIWKKKQVEGIKDEEERKKEDNRLKNILFPDKYKDRSVFTTIQDWKIEFNKHPEWQGLSTAEMGKKKEYGGCAFYTAFLKWKKKQVEGIKDEEERKKEDNRLKNILFTDKKQDRSTLRTIEDWKAEFDKHLEWQGLSSKEIIIRGGDCCGFYQSFAKWRNRQVEDIEDGVQRKKENNKLKNIVFPDKQKDRSNLITIEDWKVEFDRHLEWQGLSTEAMQNRIEDGGLAFYAAFTKWRKKQIESILNKQERKKEDNRLKNILFADRNKDRSNFTTIEDWKVEYNKHPEWQGLSTTEMEKRKKDGGSVFYSAFTIWKKKQVESIKDHTKREEEKKKLSMMLFPEIKTPLYYTFNTNRVAFDSAGERKCAMILHKLGLATKFIDGENLHVRSNGNALNSLDFKIGSVFLEYHPAQRHKTFAEGSQKKHKHITNLHHKDQTELYVFDDIYELYDIVRENRTLIHHVPVEKLHYLTHPDEFKLLVTQINKELVDYDTQNTKINNTQSQDNFISDDLTGAEINSKVA